MQRTKGYTRYQHKKHALRHRRITKEVYGIENYFHDFNKYDSFKIHCSCPMCRTKTAKRKSWGTNRKNWCVSDEKRIEEMTEQILDNEQDF